MSTLQYNKINLVVNTTPLLAESISLNEASEQRAIKSFNNNVPFDYVPTNINNSIEIKYYLEPNNEVNFYNLISGTSNTTISTPMIIYIGNTYITGYLSNYALNLSQNQIIMAQSTYKIYYPFTGNFVIQNSGDSLFYDINQQSGIAHYWSANFYSGGNINTNNQILELGYSTEIDLEPIYSIGNGLPTQIFINGVIETLSILSEQQTNVQYSGQILDNVFNGLQNLQLNNISSIWDNSINYSINIPLTGFVLQETKSDMSVGNLILWSNTFSRTR